MRKPRRKRKKNVLTFLLKFFFCMVNFVKMLTKLRKR